MCMTRIMVAALAAIGLSMTGEGTSAAENAADPAPVRPAVEVNSKSTFSLVRHPDRAPGAQIKGPVPAGLHVVDPAQGAPRIGGHASRRRDVAGPYGGPGMHGPYGGPRMAAPYGGPGMRGPYGSPGMRSAYGGPRMAGPYGGPGMRGAYGGPGMRGAYGGPGMRGAYGGPGMRGAYGGPGMRGAYGGRWHARRLWRPWHARRSLWRSWDGRPWRPADERTRLSSPAYGRHGLRRTPYGWTWLWWAAHGRRSVLRRPAHERTDLWRPAHGEASLWRA